MNTNIENAINDISQKCKVDTYSYNLVDVSKALNINIREFEFSNKDIHAVLINNEIYVSKKINEFKKRFAIAHEIGHFLLHDAKENVYFKYKNCEVFNNEQENEADDFAGELLIPKNNIEKAIEESRDYFLKKPHISEEEKRKMMIEVLSQAFQVTVKVLEYRLEKLNLSL